MCVGAWVCGVGVFGARGMEEGMGEKEREREREREKERVRERDVIRWRV